MSPKDLSSGGLHVHTEKPAYLPGETVRGHVYLNAMQPITSHGIFLKITGHEKVKWVWTETTYESETYTDAEGNEATRMVPKQVEHDRGGKNEFFKMKVPLSQGAVLQPGNYSFPFAFDLPQGLPGVYHRDIETSGAYAKLRMQTEYKVKGYCDMPGDDLKHKFNFVLNERVTDQIKGVSKYDKCDIVQCCCIKKGDCALTVRMDKNAYAPGETIKAVCEVNNDSSVDIEKVTVMLYRELKISNGESGLGNSTTILDVVSTENFPGIPQQTKYLESDARQIPLTIAGKIEPETHGKFIKNTYYCVVNLDVPWGADMKLQLPVAIYAPAPPMSAHVVPFPPGWNPQLMTAVNIGALPLGVPPPVTPDCFVDPHGGKAPPEQSGAIVVQSKAPEPTQMH